MRANSRTLFLGLLLMGLHACGGGDSEKAAPAETPATAPAPAPEPEPVASFDAAKQASEASDEDIAAYCAETLAKKGGSGNVIDCGNGKTRTVETLEKCIKDMGILKGLECDLAMSQMVACQESMAADMCAGFKQMESPECKPVYADCLFKAMEQQK